MHKAKLNSHTGSFNDTDTSYVILLNKRCGDHHGFETETHTIGVTNDENEAYRIAAYAWMKYVNEEDRWRCDDIFEHYFSLRKITTAKDLHEYFSNIIGSWGNPVLDDLPDSDVMITTVTPPSISREEGSYQFDLTEDEIETVLEQEHLSTLRNTNVEPILSYLGGSCLGTCTWNNVTAGANWITFDSESHLTKVNLEGAEISGSLSASTIKQCTLERSHLEDLTCSGATLIDVNMKGSQFINVDFSGSTLTNVDLSNSNFDNVNLCNTIMTDVNLAGVTFANIVSNEHTQWPKGFTPTIED